VFEPSTRGGAPMIQTTDMNNTNVTGNGIDAAPLVLFPAT
jgi:hypothetical protein